MIINITQIDVIKSLGPSDAYIYIYIYIYMCVCVCVCVCVSKLAIIGSDNGLSPGRRQATAWTNARILLMRTL